jgi:hypothetical protein
MQKLAIVAVSAAALISMPALAQSHDTPSSENSAQPQNASPSAKTQSRDVTHIRQHLVDQLKQDGYTNIHIVPDSFLVRAQDKQGQPVVMIINPNSVFSVTELGRNQGNSEVNPSGSNSNTGAQSNAASR